MKRHDKTEEKSQLDKTEGPTDRKTWSSLCKLTDRWEATTGCLKSTAFLSRTD